MAPPRHSPAKLQLTIMRELAQLHPGGMTPEELLAYLRGSDFPGLTRLAFGIAVNGLEAHELLLRRPLATRNECIYMLTGAGLAEAAHQAKKGGAK